MPSAQVAVRLEPEIIDMLDWYVVRCEFGTRSEAIKAAILEAIRLQKERDIDRQFIAAYTRFPVTDEELAESDASFLESVEDEPWEKWW